jgi:hypothetical protein
MSCGCCFRTRNGSNKSSSGLSDVIVQNSALSSAIMNKYDNERKAAAEIAAQKRQAGFVIPTAPSNLPSPTNRSWRYNSNVQSITKFLNMRTKESGSSIPRPGAKPTAAVIPEEKKEEPVSPSRKDRIASMRIDAPMTLAQKAREDALAAEKAERELRELEEKNQCVLQ